MTCNSTRPAFPLPTTESQLPGTRSMTLEALTEAVSAARNSEKESFMVVKLEIRYVVTGLTN